MAVFVAVEVVARLAHTYGSLRPAGASSRFEFGLFIRQPMESVDLTAIVFIVMGVATHKVV